MMAATVPFHQFGIDVVGHHARAFGCEADGRGTTDPGAGPGDDRDLSLEGTAHRACRPITA